MLQGLLNWLGKFADLYNNAFTGIDVVHSKIHKEKHFQVGHLATSIANNENLDIRFKTGVKPCHVLVMPASGGKSNFTIYEGANISAGTALTAYNNNRKSTVTTTATITHTPTVTSAGTTIIQPPTLLPGGTGGTAQGNAGTFRNELVFKANTEYLVRLTNTAGTAQDLNLLLQYYEED